MEQNTNWAAERLATLTPEWQPDLQKALVRLRAERPARRRFWLPAAATAGMLVAAAFVVPQSRVTAQELWHRLFFRGFEAVRMDFSKIPLGVSITTNGLAQHLRSVELAEQKAGYRLTMPPRSVLAEPTKLAVTGPISVRQVIQVAELEAALSKASASDIQIPREWQGLTLRMQIGPSVIADFGDDIRIAQAKPIELDIPAGFPLARFAEAAFRCGGMPWRQARAMGEKFAAQPAWLLDVPTDKAVNVEEVRVGASNGLLIEDPGGSQGQRATVLFETTDRIFAVSSRSREQSLRIAASLH